MACISLLRLRRSERKAEVYERTRKKIKLSKTRQQLSAFSAAVADGTLTASEITSMGALFSTFATDIINGLNNAVRSGSIGAQCDAKAKAQVLQWGDAGAFLDDKSEGAVKARQGISELMANGDITAIFDATTGDYKQDEVLAVLASKFRTEAVKDLIEDNLLPVINQMDKVLEEENDNNNTALEIANAELESLDQAISQAAKDLAPKFA